MDEHLAETVDAVGRGGRVVNGGGQGLDRDVGQLADAELHVLLPRPVEPEDERRPDGIGQLRPPVAVTTQAARGPDSRQRGAGQDELADEGLHPYKQIVLLGYGKEHVGVDGLQVAAPAGADDAAGRARRPRPACRQRGRVAAGGITFVDQFQSVVGHVADGDRDLDQAGNMVDVVDHYPDADQRQADGDGNRDGGDERLDPLVLRPRADRAQHEQRVGEGAEEDAEDVLGAFVAGEGAQHSRRELGHGDLQRHHRHGEDDGDDANHGAGDGEERPARHVRVAGQRPAGAGARPRPQHPVDLDQRQGERAVERRHQRGREPEAVLEVAPPRTEACLHRAVSPGDAIPRHQRAHHTSSASGPTALPATPPLGHDASRPASSVSSGCTGHRPIVSAESVSNRRSGRLRRVMAALNLARRRVVAGTRAGAPRERPLDDPDEVGCRGSIEESASPRHGPQLNRVPTVRVKHDPPAGAGNGAITGRWRHLRRAPPR